MAAITRLLPVLALLVPGGCQNQFQAPEAEGPEGAALNVGLGAAVAPLHRAATGCYTPCAYGTVCDEASGTCVSRECATGDESCAQGGPATAVSIGSAAPPAPLPVCTPACLGGEVCVVEAGKPTCRAGAASGAPPPAPTVTSSPPVGPAVPGGASPPAGTAAPPPTRVP